MAQTNTEKLLALKQEIEQAKLDSAGIKGAIEQNMKRLKDDFGVRSLEQAKAKLQKLKEQKDNLQEQITKAVEKLESEYSW